jgi:hypothetical protein
VASSARTREDFGAAVVLAAASLLSRWEEGMGDGNTGAVANGGPGQLTVPDAATAISFVVAPAFDLG